jgi:hypothetical protein
MYIPSFIKIRSSIQKSMGGHTQTYAHTHTDSKVISKDWFSHSKVNAAGGGDAHTNPETQTAR